MIPGLSCPALLLAGSKGLSEFSFMQGAGSLTAVPLGAEDPNRWAVIVVTTASADNTPNAQVGVMTGATVNGVAVPSNMIFGQVNAVGAQFATTVILAKIPTGATFSLVLTGPTSARYHYIYRAVGLKVVDAPTFSRAVNNSANSIVRPSRA